MIVAASNDKSVSLSMWPWDERNQSYNIIGTLPPKMITNTMSENLTASAESLETPPAADAAQKRRSLHAQAQANYRIRARKGQGSLREKRKVSTTETERNERGQTYEEFMECECREFRATDEFQEWREYCNTVKVVRVTPHPSIPSAQDLAEMECFRRKHPYPCVGDLPPFDDDYVEFLYHHTVGRYPEWKEELADFRDFVAEHTEEELDKLQRASNQAQRTKLVIRARGGF
ncbi:hypothetical protein B0H15DRAFT_957799 [Mycena belliarum]|uniref:Uncharacterized protein n=1 Tax=Mycena belliarum TaxID=1033014 RepID=A0AAD6TPB5_9AGAR|nr:hypothetical protein B0H15DRAFT_957799 [Mycena belliae]